MGPILQVPYLKSCMFAQFLHQSVKGNSLTTVLFHPHYKCIIQLVMQITIHKRKMMSNLWSIVSECRPCIYRDAPNVHKCVVKNVVKWCAMDGVKVHRHTVTAMNRLSLSHSTLQPNNAKLQFMLIYCEHASPLVTWALNKVNSCND